jgi:hypothetical protein
VRTTPPCVFAGRESRLGHSNGDSMVRASALCSTQSPRPVSRADASHPRTSRAQGVQRAAPVVLSGAADRVAGRPGRRAERNGAAGSLRLGLRLLRVGPVARGRPAAVTPTFLLTSLSFSPHLPSHLTFLLTSPSFSPHLPSHLTFLLTSPHLSFQDQLILNFKIN